jgi:hypothetical protein
VRAKGVAPYNAEGRKLAGIDSDWIEFLEVEEQSRGRTPVLHWFNPNAESEEVARLNKQPFTAKRNVTLLEEDLDMVPLAWARRDDVLLLRKEPSREHLRNIRAWGFPMPECISVNDPKDLKERRIGGMRPWAWQQKASDVLEPFSHTMSENVGQKWRGSSESKWMSKRMGYDLEKLLGEPVGEWCISFEALETYVEKSDGDVLLKAAYSNAGRGHCRLLDGEWTKSAQGWARRVLKEHGAILVEPWLDRVIDFSAQYEVDAKGEIKHVGMTRVLNDDLGRFRGSLVLPKWAQGVDSELSAFLFRDSNANAFYKYEVPELLKKLMEGCDYVGAIGVDSMVYRDSEGQYVFRPVVEVNVRHTMGRVAVELLKKTAPGLGGHYEIVRKSQLEALPKFGPEQEGGLQTGFTAGTYVLNDPSQAEEFLAVYRVAKPTQLLGV